MIDTIYDGVVPPGGAAVEAPPPPQRRSRGRVREISSRFMSPQVPSIATVAECQLSMSMQRRRHHQTEEESRAFEGTTRSLDSTPLVVAFGSHNRGSTKASNFPSYKKNQQQLRPNKENNNNNNEEATKADLASQLKGTSSSVFGGGRISSSSRRPDTPIVLAAVDRDKIIPSRYRLTATPSCHRPSVSSSANSGTSAAAKLLQEATSGTGGTLNSYRLSNESNDDRVSAPLQKKLYSLSRSKSDSSSSSSSDLCTSTNIQQGGSSCPNSPICISSNKTRTLSDVRSSMPEVDMLPTRWQPNAERNSFDIDEICNDLGTSSTFTSSSTCSRSLNFPASASRTLVKNQTGSACLPPHPSCIKLGVDARKGRKQLFSHQEEKHSLKLLYNHYLQWRFANAKAEASMRAQNMETERQLNCLSRKLSEMRGAVKRKRIELALLQRMKMLSRTVETQMLYLDQWSAMEEDYSTSLSGVVNSLQNLSLRLPIGGEVKVDATALGETLNSAMKVMEMIALHIETFMSKAEETENLVSDLAMTVGGEIALIDECGDSLFKVYASQVEECSLRGHLFQSRRDNPCEP